MFEDDDKFNLENCEIKGVNVQDCENYEQVINKIAEKDGKKESAFTVMPYTEVDKEKAKRFLEDRLDKEKVESFLEAI